MADENIEINDKVLIKERQTNLQIGETLNRDMLAIDDSWKKAVVNAWKTLRVDEMEATRYQPILSRHFVFALDGVDAFLVKRVERAPFIRKTGLFQKTKPRELVVYFHEAVAPSASQQIKELQENPLKVNAKLKMLDPIGTIVGLISWKGIQVEKVEYSPFDYDSKALAEIKVTLSFTKEVREY